MTRIAEEAQNGEFGWFGFKGTMIVAQSDGPLLSLSTATLVPQPSVVAQTRQLPAWWLIAIGAIVLLLIVRMIMLWRRRRQIKEVIEEHGVEEAADPGPPTA
jgi:glycerol-3-phosphate acyltransferase PlsY